MGRGPGSLGSNPSSACYSLSDLASGTIALCLSLSVKQR